MIIPAFAVGRTQEMLYFLKKISCDRIYPMHYWEQPEIITRFLAEYPQYQNRILLTEPTDAK